MKTKEEWGTEINKTIGQKVNAAIKQYQEARSLEIDELAKLSQQLEDFEAQKKSLADESGTLNLLKTSDRNRRNIIDRTAFSLEKHLRETRRQIDAIIEKATVIPSDIESTWLLTQLKHLQVRKGG